MMKILDPRISKPSLFEMGIVYALLEENPGMYSPALALNVELAFRRCCEMDTQTLDNFVTFFSNILVNFEFQWSWSHWNAYLDTDEEDTQRIFLSSVLERCVRLSYAMHLEKKLPKDFHVLLPPPPTPTLEFDKEKNETYAEILNLILKKAEESEISEWIKNQTESETSWSMLNSALFASLSSTVSHSQMTIDRYRNLLTRYSREDDCADKLIGSLMQVWQNSPHHSEVFVQMMTRRGILTPLSVVQWCLSDVQQFSWPYIWKQITECCLRAQNFAKLANEDEGTDPAAKTALREQYETVLLTVMEGILKLLVKNLRCGQEEVWLINTLRRWRAFVRLFESDLHSFFDGSTGREMLAPLLRADGPQNHPIVRMYQTMFCGSSIV